MVNVIKKLNNYTFAQEFREQTVFTSSVGLKTNIADFFFRKSQVSYQYKRKLGNILTILSYLGGIWSTGFIILYFIFCEYSKNKFIMKLSNKIYNYPSEKKRKSTKKLTKLKNFPFDDPLPLSPKRSSLSGYEIVIAKIKEYLTFERKLEVGFCQLFRMIALSIFPCGKKNEKLELFEKSKEALMDDLDLYNILRRIHESEKLKNLIVSSDQQKILNFCPKPNIYPPSHVDPSLKEVTLSTNFRDAYRKSLKRIAIKKIDTNNKLFSEQKQFNDLQIFKDLIISWRKLKSNAQQSEMDKNLITMFGEEFSTVVDLDDDILEGFFEDSHTKEKNLKETKFGKLIELNKGFFLKKKQKCLQKETFQSTGEDGRTLNTQNFDYTKRLKSMESENFMDINEQIEGLGRVFRDYESKDTDKGMLNEDNLEKD